MCFHHLVLFVSAHMSLQNEIPLIIVKLYGLVMPKTVIPKWGFPLLLHYVSIGLEGNESVSPSGF